MCEVFMLYYLLGGVVLDLKREIGNIYYSEVYLDLYR